MNILEKAGIIQKDSYKYAIISAARGRKTALLQCGQ